MAANCPLISSESRATTDSYTYVADYTGVDLTSAKRLRFLLDYRNASKYDCLDRKTGLYVELSGQTTVTSVDYIQWNTPEHPPMAEPASEYTGWIDESFNSEYVAYVTPDSNKKARVTFKAYVNDVMVPLTTPSDTQSNDCTLSGESYVKPGADQRRLNVLAETLVSQTNIVSLAYDKGVVVVTTENAHGFTDGDAITIRGVEHCAHSQGVNGERYNGIFRVYDCTEYSFKYRSVFDGTLYSPLRSSFAVGHVPTASKWTVQYWDETVSIYRASKGSICILWGNDANAMSIGDKYYLQENGSAAVEATVTDVDGEIVTMALPNGTTIQSVSVSIRLAARVPSSDVPANYSGSASNIPNYSHASSTSFMAVYDDTTVSPSQDGTISISSPTLTVDSDNIVVFKFNPGYSASGANTLEVTCHIETNQYPSVTLALYELSNHDWDASVTESDVRSYIVNDILDSATVFNPGLSGGTAVRFIVTGSVAERWYSSGGPVALAIRALGENTIDSMELCSTESEYPITVVGGAGKQATLNPNLFSISVRPTVPVSGTDVTIYALGSGEFSGVPGMDVVKFNDETLEIVSTSTESIMVSIPKTISGSGYLQVFRVSNSETIPASEATWISIRAVKVVDVMLSERIKPGIGTRIVSRSATYTKDLAFNGFTEVTDGNNLVQNVYNCILTNRGERLFNAKFGTSLEDALFSLYDGSNGRKVIDECVKAISAYEPRVQVNYTRSYVSSSQGGNALTVVLCILIPGRGEQEIVLPFSTRGRMV